MSENAKALPDELLAGLDDDQRADFLARAEQVRADHAANPAPTFRRAHDGSKRPINGDAVVIPLRGIGRALASQGADVDRLNRAMTEAVEMRDDPEEQARADRLLEQAEQDERKAFRAHRASKRHLAYLKQRNQKYADASYDLLTPAQNPRGLITRWMDSDRRTLLLVGRARTGKTTAAHAITNDAHSRKLWVESWTEAALIRALRKDNAPQNGRREDTTNMGVWDRVTRCDLLYLDDIGRTKPSDWWLGTLWELLDLRFSRSNEGLRLIVTANTAADPRVAYEELIERYDDPTIERIVDGGGLVLFDGPAIRDFKTDW
jgi:DNA replication protein DnaC